MDTSPPLSSTPSLSPAAAVHALVTELKTRARLLRNATRQAQPPWRLRDCLHQVARDAGFAHWDHALKVLGGQSVPGDDMGTFWHAPACDALLNSWFASYGEARIALQNDGGGVLLPYRRQFVLAGDDYIRELGLDPRDAAWPAVQRDVVRAYGTGPWRTLALQRLKAPRASFAASRSSAARATRFASRVARIA
jgi:hypothetical protein